MRATMVDISESDAANGMISQNDVRYSGCYKPFITHKTRKPPAEQKVAKTKETKEPSKQAKVVPQVVVNNSGDQLVRDKVAEPKEEVKVEVTKEVKEEVKVEVKVEVKEEVKVEQPAMPPASRMPTEVAQKVMKASKGGIAVVTKKHITDHSSDIDAPKDSPPDAAKIAQDDAKAVASEVMHGVGAAIEEAKEHTKAGDMAAAMAMDKETAKKLMQHTEQNLKVAQQLPDIDTIKMVKDSAVHFAQEITSSVRDNAVQFANEITSTVRSKAEETWQQAQSIAQTGQEAISSLVETAQRAPGHVITAGKLVQLKVAYIGDQVAKEAKELYKEANESATEVYNDWQEGKEKFVKDLNRWNVQVTKSTKLKLEQTKQFAANACQKVGAAMVIIGKSAVKVGKEMEKEVTEAAHVSSDALDQATKAASTICEKTGVCQSTTASPTYPWVNDMAKWGNMGKNWFNKMASMAANLLKAEPKMNSTPSEMATAKSDETPGKFYAEL